MRPRLLDLFCGAGGAAVGYHRAGFEVVGVDIKPQPNYPYKFWQEDALKLLRALIDWEKIGLYDAIHASPPCQANVKGMAEVNRTLGREYAHVDLIAETRELLQESGLPYVIENVVGAKLIDPVRLCGSSFGLPIRRHRLFESNAPLTAPPCDHSWQTEKKYWNGDRSVRLPNGKRKYTGHDRRSSVVQIYGAAKEAHEWPAAMGIDWMTNEEMVEAIPPVYTEVIGAHLRAAVRSR